MALNQVVKIPSEQSQFDRTGAKNNVDFILPGGQVYDLSRSYISVSLDSFAEDSTNTEFFAKTVLNLGSSMDGTAFADDITDRNKIVHNRTGASLVKNAHMSSQNGGKISDIRRVDKYAFNKSLYTVSTQDARNDISQFNSKVSEDLLGFMPSQEYHKVGTETSRDRTHDVKIPLKEIWPYCRTTNHDGNRHGATRLHTELNFNNINSKAIASDQNVDKVPCTAGAGVADDINGANTMREILNIVVDTTTPNKQKTLITKGKYGSSNFCPFYVGQTVQVEGAVAPTNAVTIGGAANKKKIVEIVRNADDSLSLVLQPELVLSAGNLTTGQTLQGMKVVDESPLFSGAGNVTIGNVELVTEIAQSPPQKSGVVTYETVLSEEDTYATTSNLNRVYDVPPMCKNFYMLFFKGGSGVVSDEAHLNSYRVTLDNIEQSQGEVVVGSPEHKDNLIRVFSNGGGNLASLSEKYFLTRSNTNGGNIGERSCMVAYPVPFLNRGQKLQVELSATTGQTLSGRLIIFYDVVKQV